MDEVAIQISNNGLNNKTEDEDTLIPLTIPAQLKRCGMEMKMVSGDVQRIKQNDPSLIRLLTKAHIIFEKLTSTDRLSITEIARQDKMSPSYLTRLVRLASISPRIQEAILFGKQPPTLTANYLMNIKYLPVDWSEQGSLIGL